jgi:hypothetical protein
MALRTALGETGRRIEAPDGQGWWRTEVLMPRLRHEEDIETVAVRTADRAPGGPDFAACRTEAVTEVLSGWRRRFGSIASAAPVPRVRP